MKRTRLISKHWVLFLSAVTMIAAARPAAAAKVEVGSCLAGLPKFSTIQAAVSGVPPFSTILVCPGVYPEQVTISQPLTLRGQGIANMDRPVVAVPQNPAGGPGLTVNVTSINGETFAAQVLVQNVSPVGKVTIINITVDGTGGNLGCPSGTGLAGIFYASGTEGSVEGVTARNQQNSGCGFGIWAENGAGPNQTIIVGNDSVHDMDSAGIVALSNQNPPTLAVTIETSSVTGNNSTQGIVSEGVGGTIYSNVVTGGAIGIVDVDFFQQTPGIAISYNSVADVQAGAGIGIVVRGGSTATHNKISNVLTAFYLQGGSAANPGPTLLANTAKNTALGVEFNCTANTTLNSNFNDSQVGFDNVPSGTSLPTAIYNIDTIKTGSCP
jgi:hypothetical protein